MTHASDALALRETFDFHGQAVRWGQLGTQGPALVMVHGTPFSAHVWRRIAPLFAQHCRVFYYDLLGYGQSQRRRGRTSPSACKTPCWPHCLNIGAWNALIYSPMILAVPRHCARICWIAATTPASP